MTMTVNGASTNGFFPSSSRIRIVDLEHETGRVSDRHVEATVSLVWPYSSSTRKFSLLLSETDARPLKSRRQVRVTFHNGAAKAAQESRIGIGDVVKLSLNECTWHSEQDEISTPGKRLDQDIEFRRALMLEVNPNTPSTRLVHYIWNGTPSPEPTPTMQTVLEVIGEVEINPSKKAVNSNSPANRNPFRLSSGSFMEASLDPFAEDKEYVYGRNRKRTKFARDNGAWRLLDAEEDVPEVEASSPLPGAPVNETSHAHVETALQQSHVPSETINITSPIADTLETIPSTAEAPDTAETNEPPGDQFIMPPPQTPARSAPKEDRYIAIPEQPADETTTPRLHPLASPSLPMVSPLVSRFGVDVGYFSNASALISELDASSVSTRDRNGSMASTGSEQSPIVIEPPTTQENGVRQDGCEAGIGSQAELAQIQDVIEDEDMYGAPEKPAPVQQELPAEAVSSALDVLEQFLQMAPTTPEATEQFPEIEFSAPQQAASNHLEQKGRDISRSTSVVSLVDGTYEDNEREPPKPSESASSDTSSSALEQQPLVDVQSIDSESVFSGDESEYFSKDHSGVSGDESEYSSEDHSRVSEDDHELETESECTKAVVTEDRNDEQPRHATPQLDLPVTYELQNVPSMPTPAQTQEPDLVMIDVQRDEFRHLDDASHLPTPNQTQEDTALPQIQPSIFQPETETVVKEEEVELPEDLAEVAKEEDAEQPEPSAATDPDKLRGVSERPTRISMLSDKISSPYFTPRRPAPSAEPSAAEAGQASRGLPIAEDQPTSPDRQTRKKTPPADQHLLLPQPLIDSRSDDIENSSSRDPVSKVSKTLRRKPAGLTTSIAYYSPLSSLHEYLNQLVDVIVICADDPGAPERAKNGPKDWLTTLQVVDPSSEHVDATKQVVQVFRPAKTALPISKRGDAIVLRDFKVQTQQHKTFLLSTDSSAWAVFDGRLDERSMTDDPNISGPPLEYGRGETAYLKKLAGWWKSEGAQHFAAQPAKSKERAPVDSQALQTQLPTNGGVVDANTQSPLKAPRQTKGHLAIETRPATAQDDAIASVEQPPKSPVRTRRQQRLAEEITQEGDEQDMAAEGTMGRKHQAPSMTPSRRQPSRRTKTPATVRSSDDVATHDNSSPRSASPKITRRTKTTKSSSTVHELRDGTQYVDGDLESFTNDKSSPQQASPRSSRRTRATNSPGTMHELRDGTQYVDDISDVPANDKSSPQQASPRTTRRTRATISPGPVHELRDGTQYLDNGNTAPAQDVSPPQQASSRTTRRTRATKSPSTMHELRDGTKYVDDGNEKKKGNAAVHELRDGTRYADDA